jgi:pimeloyl-ACP methyl ester carboxylesterase
MLRKLCVGYVGCEALFWVWSSSQRKKLGQPLPPYCDSASGRPFLHAERRRAVDDLLTTEFEIEDGVATAPKRGQQWLSGWFFGTPFDAIARSRARDFLAWAWFNKTTADELASEELEEVEADLTRLEHLSACKLAAESCGSSAQHARDDAARERSGALDCMRPNIDDTALFDAHRPLCVYALTDFAMRCRSYYVMRSLGFERRSVGGMAYWARARALESATRATIPEHDEKSRAPIVLFHGIGLGWCLYSTFLRELVEANDAAAETSTSGGAPTPLLLVETPSVALTLPFSSSPKPIDAVRDVEEMLRKEGLDGNTVALWGHSYGTLSVGWLLKKRPELVHSCTLVDPVNVGVQRATLCRSFLYEPRARSKMQRFKRWLLHSDPRLVATLTRRFFWFENVLWLSDDELNGGGDNAARRGGSVALFIAKRDRYIDGEVVYADAVKAQTRRRRSRSKTGGTAGRELSTTLWGDLNHGGWMNAAPTRREVILSTLASAERER